MKRLGTLLTLSSLLLPVGLAAQRSPMKVFISVDMEGISGVGTGAMTSATGKDYATARRLMTEDVNAVVAAIFGRGPAEVVVNDSHGDMQNILHLELDPRVTYIQGSMKPWGMVEALDATYDAAIFVGYHARAGTPNGFLAHTGTGSVKGLWLNGVEVGEGGLNAAFAGEIGVPVILASGDSVFVEQFTSLVPTRGVVTKWAVTPGAARLRHPAMVRQDLMEAATRALDGLASAEPYVIGQPVTVRMRFADTTKPQMVEAIPGVVREDGYTVVFTSATMKEAYRMIRFLYRFVST